MTLTKRRTRRTNRQRVNVDCNRRPVECREMIAPRHRIIALPAMEDMMKALLTTIASILIAASTAANASPAVQRHNDAQAKKICLSYKQDTGSRITRTECHTKADWQALGIDVDDQTAKDDSTAKPASVDA
jgi:hypothetical protein